MTKYLITSALAFLAGVFLIECGILSVMVSFAYAGADGAAVAFLAGACLAAAGSLSVVLAVRLFRRKAGRNRRTFFGP
ncbi:MAG: hypothetical protein LBR80_00655 [Deltaproteobacteria bacterium]|jgi:hypothetical protein|nr:hypothetical protein [Deltaproteobacteria bacterium]